MEAWLWALIDVLPTPIRAGAKLLIGGIVRAWRWGYNLARRHRTGWVEQSFAARLLSIGLDDLGVQTYATLGWLTRIRLPRIVTGAISAAEAVAGRAIASARRWLGGLIADAVAWTLGQLRTLGAALTAVKAWLAARLDAVEARLIAWARGPLRLLLSPTALAAWLAGAMWSALWTYAYARLDSIAEAIWRTRRRLILTAIMEAERIIGRLL